MNPESAMADYLNELLLPQEEPATPALDWAEPPVLDPRVFAPALKLPAEPQVRVTAEPAPALPATAQAEPPVVAKAPVQAPAPAMAPVSSTLTPARTVAKAITAEAPAQPQVTPEPAIRQSRWVDGRPEWAQTAFDCLLFSVNGLKLAVPLVLLGAVHPLDTELTHLFGRPSWFMGLLTRGNRTLRVVDTAQWVMPDRYRTEAAAGYGFVIRLDNSEWGLACDEVAQSFKLRPDEVKWRSEDSRRPWLAGTAKSQMCALLDVGRFGRMLEEAEKTRQLDLES